MDWVGSLVGFGFAGRSVVCSKTFEGRAMNHCINCSESQTLPTRLAAAFRKNWSKHQDFPIV